MVHLEIWVMGHSRSLKMESLNRSHTTSYWSAIVSIDISYIIFELLNIEKYCDLKI